MVLTMKQALIDFAFSTEKVKVLLDWHEEKLAALKEFPLGMQQQWSVVSKVNARPDFAKEVQLDLLEKQCAKDPSQARKKKLSCNALRLDCEEDRLKHWSIFLDKNSEFSLNDKELM